jgi:hypothetical protein
LFCKRSCIRLERFYVQKCGPVLSKIEDKEKNPKNHPKALRSTEKAPRSKIDNKKREGNLQELRTGTVVLEYDIGVIMGIIMLGEKVRIAGFITPLPGKGE